MFVDDGDSLQTYESESFSKIKFVFDKRRFQSVVEHCGYNVTQPVSDVEIFGLENVDAVTNVTCDGKPVKFVIDSKIKVNFFFLRLIPCFNFPFFKFLIKKISFKETERTRFNESRVLKRVKLNCFSRKLNAKRFEIHYDFIRRTIISL